MKIPKLLFAFSPLAFFYALAGNVSAQVVVLNPGLIHHPGFVAHHPGTNHHQGFAHPGFVHQE